jgi:hypothetical protein
MIFPDGILDAEADEYDDRCRQRIEHLPNKIVLSQCHVAGIPKRFDQDQRNNVDREATLRGDSSQAMK